VPQISAISETERRVGDRHGIPIIAERRSHNSGGSVKAIAAAEQRVMIGCRRSSTGTDRVRPAISSSTRGPRYKVIAGGQHRQRDAQREPQIDRFRRAGRRGNSGRGHRGASCSTAGVRSRRILYQIPPPACSSGMAPPGAEHPGKLHPARFVRTSRPRACAESTCTTFIIPRQAPNTFRPERASSPTARTRRLRTRRTP